MSEAEQCHTACDSLTIFRPDAIGKIRHPRKIVKNRPGFVAIYTLKRAAAFHGPDLTPSRGAG
jgi:hypothetical protein